LQRADGDTPAVRTLRPQTAVTATTAGERGRQGSR
jgi:hypothetical protein